MSRSLAALLILLGYLVTLHPAATAQDEDRAARKKRNAAKKVQRQDKEAPGVNVWKGDLQEEELEEFEEELEEELEALEERLEKWANSHAEEWEQWAEQMERRMETWAEKTEQQMENWAEKTEAAIEQMAEKYAHQFESLAEDMEHNFKPEQVKEMLHLHLKQLENLPMESLHIELSELGKETNVPLNELNHLYEHLAGALENSIVELELHQEEGDKVGQTSQESKKLKVALKEMEAALAANQEKLAQAAKQRAAEATELLKKKDLDAYREEKARAEVMARALREKALHAAQEHQVQAQQVARQALDKLMATRDAKAADLRDQVLKLKKIRASEKDVPAELVRAIEASESQLHQLEDQLHRMGEHLSHLDRNNEEKEAHNRLVIEKERRLKEEKQAYEMHRQKADMERLHDELLHRTRRIEEKESEIEAMRDELEALRRELEAIRRKDR